MKRNNKAKRMYVIDKIFDQIFVTGCSLLMLVVIQTLQTTLQTNFHGHVFLMDFSFRITYLNRILIKSSKSNRKKNPWDWYACYIYIWRIAGAYNLLTEQVAFSIVL